MSSAAKKSETMNGEPVFIPTTREVSIGDGVVYRPVRMWHSGTYGGEGLTSMRGDGSGCVRETLITDSKYGPYTEKTMSPPKTVTTRLYWNVANPKDTVSAFLSYPNGMGCCDEYFWEAMGTRQDGDIERWVGDSAEADMERAILAVLGDSARNSDDALAASAARVDQPRRIKEAKNTIRKTVAKLRAGKNLEEILMEEDSDDDPFTIN